VFAHQLLDRRKWLGASLDTKLQLAKNLRHRASRFVIGTEEKSLVTHKNIVGTAVSSGKLRW
jgi:hypothetical protein